MQDQPSFVVLESVMIAVAVVVLNVGHPGFMFVRAGRWSGRVRVRDLRCRWRRGR